MKNFVIGLTLLFIGLKLTDHVDWNWWQVLSPIWAPVAGLIVMIALLALFSQDFRDGFNERYKELRAERRARKMVKDFTQRKNDDTFEA